MTKIDKLLENIIQEIQNSITKKIIIKPMNQELINYIDKQQNLHVLVKITSSYLSLSFLIFSSKEALAGSPSFLEVARFLVAIAININKINKIPIGIYFFIK